VKHVRLLQLQTVGKSRPYKRVRWRNCTIIDPSDSDKQIDSAIRMKAIIYHYSASLFARNKIPPIKQIIDAEDG
jgi:hypothetical protein